MKKFSVFALLIACVVGGLIVTYELVVPSIASASKSTRIQNAQYERDIKGFLNRNMAYFTPSKDWVEVKNCSITYRLNRNSECMQGEVSKYTEYRIDLKEIKKVHYFEVARPKPNYKGSITFEFTPSVKQQFDAAKDYFWKASGTKKGHTASMWSTHLEIEEQNVIHQMDLDKLGSYSMTENCSRNERKRHLPYAMNTINLTDLNREAVRSIQRYHENCVNGWSS